MQPRSDDPALPVRLVRVLLAICAFYAALTAIILSVVAMVPLGFVNVRAEQIDPLFSSILGHGIAGVMCASAMLLLRHRRSMSSRTAKAMLLMATFGWLLSIDRIADVIYPAPSQRGRLFHLHPQRGWAHNRSVEGFAGKPVRLDDLGFRVAEEGPIREIRGKRRILFLGDSLTFAFGHFSATSYCEQAVDILNRRRPGSHLACLNAGVMGYDPGQEYHLLVSECLDLKPSLVVLQLCLNDLTHQFDRAAWIESGRHLSLEQATRPTHWSGLHRLAIRVGERLWANEEESRAAAEQTQHFQFEELLAPTRSDRVERAWQRTLGQIDPIVDTCREQGLPLVIVCFPIWQQVEDAGASLEPQRVFEAFARRRTLVYLDVLPAWEARLPRSPEAAARFLFDDTHPTELGHRLAAEALVDTLETQGILDQVLKR